MFKTTVQLCDHTNLDNALVKRFEDILKIFLAALQSLLPSSGIIVHRALLSKEHLEGSLKGLVTSVSERDNYQCKNKLVQFSVLYTRGGSGTEGGLAVHCIIQYSRLYIRNQGVLHPFTKYIHQKPASQYLHDTLAVLILVRQSQAQSVFRAAKSKTQSNKLLQNFNQLPDAFRQAWLRLWA